MARAAKRKERRRRRKTKSFAARLSTPKSTALVLTLQPAAEGERVTYRDVLNKVKAEMKASVQELGIPSVWLRVTATGARMFEVTGADSGPNAD